jgi:aminoglycoside/choline kinase family phosphotransferase
MLAAAGADGADRLASVTALPLSREAGAFGDVIRLQLTYTGSSADALRSLIVKLPSHIASNRAQARSFDMYAREVHFYRDIAPALNMRVPACIWTTSDEKSGDAVLVLEDLASLSRAEQLEGVDADRAELALQRLAAVHAQWWDSDRLGELGWLRPLGGWTDDRLVETCRDRWSAFVHMYRDCLPASTTGLGERLLTDLDDVVTTLTSAPTTLLHGDFRADNIFFDDSSREQPVAVVDWQLCCRGRGASDVAYLLCQSVRVEDRRRHEMSILRSWHRALLSDGVSNYSLDDAVADYRQGAQLCLAYAVLGSALERGGRAAAEARVQVQRTVTAALDLAAA